MPRDLCMKYYVMGIGLIVFDQLVKLLIRLNLTVGESINILGDFFRITYVQNRGAAFSILSGQRILLILLPVALIGVVLWHLHRSSRKHPLMYTSGMLIICGGLGNLIDRAFFGFVTDMISFSIFPPVFNMADICITVGCFMFLLYALLEDKLEKKDER